MTYIAISFDDGRKDNFTIVLNTLLTNEIPATFNITTGYVDKTSPLALYPSNKAAMTIEQVKQLAAYDYFEIALHGNNHLNTAEDISCCRMKLMKWLDLSDNHLFGFASPKSCLKKSIFNDSCYDGISDRIAYMRTGLRINSLRCFRVLARKITRVLHLPLLFRIAYKETVMKTVDNQLLFSVPVLRDTTFPEVKSLIDYAVGINGSIVFQFHSIERTVNGVDNWTWSENKFLLFCDYLNKMRECGKLKLSTCMELYEKIKN